MYVPSECVNNRKEEVGATVFFTTTQQSALTAEAALAAATAERTDKVSFSLRTSMVQVIWANLASTSRSL